MLCQFCREKEANFHSKIIVNGQTAEIHACADCARERGLLDAIGSHVIADMFGQQATAANFFSGMVAPQSAEAAGLPGVSARCPTCGTEFSEAARTGYVGCADCYKTFKPGLMPLIRRIHGSNAHTGKQPAADPKRDERTAMRRQLQDWEAEQRQAIAAQNFEHAAVLRDKIREMKEQLTINN